METWKSRRELSNAFQVLKDISSQPRLIYPVKIFATLKGERKTHYDIDNPKIYHQKTKPKENTRSNISGCWEDDHSKDWGKKNEAIITEAQSTKTQQHKHCNHHTHFNNN